MIYKELIECVHFTITERKLEIIHKLKCILKTDKSYRKFEFMKVQVSCVFVDSLTCVFVSHVKLNAGDVAVGINESSVPFSCLSLSLCCVV